MEGQLLPSASACVSTPTISRNVKAMAGLGVLRLERHGITVKCFLADTGQEPPAK